MASVPYEYACDEQAGFAMGTAHVRFGYVTSLTGLGMTTPFSRDLAVSVPFNSSVPPSFQGLQYQPRPSLTTSTSGATVAGGGAVGSAKVVGVMEKFSWNGGVGDAITLSFYVSRTTATQIKSLQQTSTNNTRISSLAWWIADYDPQAKMWFEQAYPLSGSISGILQGAGAPALNVDLSPGSAQASAMQIYKVALTVGPAANLSYSLQFANTLNAKVIKSWGLVVGTMA